MNKKVLKVFGIFALIAICAMILDTTMGYAAGTGLAFAMMAIGDIDDVSDRLTHGSNIAYQIYLIDVTQVDASKPFPLPNASREVATIPMKLGQYMKYFIAHDIPTFSATGEKGDITTSGTNTFTAIMGGMRDKLLNFIEQHAGGKFIIIFKEVGDPTWYVLGSYDRPMILSSFEAKNDKDGRYVTYTFTRESIDQYYKYVGTIVRKLAEEHAKDNATLTVKPEQDAYNIPNGTSSTYAISKVAGLSANDKGRFITLHGTGEANAATIAENTVFILEDGKTWTAKSGSSITFRVLDPNTLVEVPGSRVQIV